MKKLMILAWLTCSFSFAQTLSLEKQAFAPSEKIAVGFTAPGNYPDNAWIGIVPSEVPHGDEAINDQHDITYQYLHKQTSGILYFTAPGKGAFDFRMHDTDSGGKEVASVSFTVGQVGPVGAGSAALWLDRDSFVPGAAILVHFTSPSHLTDDAWVGIIPASVPHGSEAVNDQHDLTYQYLRRRTSGTLQFTAPAATGRYDFRMHDTDQNGNEIASASFMVVPQQASCGLGIRWEVHDTIQPGSADPGWQGVWTRRGDSDLFDARWTRSGEPDVTAVLRIHIEGTRVSVQRTDDPNKFLVTDCMYEGTLAADGTRVDGTVECNSGVGRLGPFQWQANIICE